MALRLTELFCWACFCSCHFHFTIGAESLSGLKGNGAVIAERTGRIFRGLRIGVWGWMTGWWWQRFGWMGATKNSTGRFPFLIYAMFLNADVIHFSMKLFSIFCIIFGVAWLDMNSIHAADVIAGNSNSWFVVGPSNVTMFNPNRDVFWRGIWVEGTNGWRVELSFYGANSHDLTMSVDVGSTQFNSGGGYFSTPDGHFSQFELFDTNGVIVPPKRGLVLEGYCPDKIRVRDFPRWPDGEIKGDFGFFSNGPPDSVGEFKLNRSFQIKQEADYTLKVCPVLYEMGPDPKYFYKLDLPCVTTRLHLLPGFDDSN